MPLTPHSKPVPTQELPILTHLNPRMEFTPFQQEKKSEIPYNSCSEANTYFGSSCSKLVSRSK